LARVIKDRRDEKEKLIMFEGVQINRDEPTYTFRLTNEVALRWTSLSIVLFIVVAAGVSTFYTFFHGQSWTLNLVDRSTNPAWQIIIVLLYFLGIPIATFIIHELIHGLAFAAFGGNPRYGVGIEFFLPYAYATAPGHLFSRNAFLIIGLTPLIVIDAIALLLTQVAGYATLAAKPPKSYAFA
jgi:Putative zincin peptidase